MPAAIDRLAAALDGAAREQHGLEARLQPHQRGGMKLRDPRFVHVHTCGALLHGQLLLIVESDDPAFPVAQVGKRAAQNFTLLAAVAASVAQTCSSGLRLSFIAREMVSGWGG